MKKYPDWSLLFFSSFFYKVPAKLRKKRKNPVNDRTFDCQLPRTHQGLHMERTGNIRLSRHQMFAILPLKRNLIVLQIEKRRLICHQSETLSPLPAHFFFSLIKVKRVDGARIDDPLVSDDSRWWLNTGGVEEKHSPCLCPTQARNSSRRCLSSLLSRSLWGNNRERQKHGGDISAQSVFRELWLLLPSSALSRLFV